MSQYQTFILQVTFWLPNDPMSYFYLATEAGCPVAVCRYVAVGTFWGQLYRHLKHHSVDFHAGEDNAQLLIFIA